MIEKNSIKSKFYQIRIEGHMDEIRASGLAGLTLSLLPDGQTLISGKIKDQAELFGILIRIRDMGIPLISVNRSEISISKSSHFTEKGVIEDGRT